MSVDQQKTKHHSWLGLQHGICLKIMEESRGLEFSRSCGIILLPDFSCSRYCMLRSNIYKCPVLVLELSGVGNNAILKSWLISTRKDLLGCFEQISVMLWGHGCRHYPTRGRDPLEYSGACILFWKIWDYFCPMHSSILCSEPWSFYAAMNVFCFYLCKRVELFKILAKSQFLPCPLYANLSCRSCLLW